VKRIEAFIRTSRLEDVKLALEEAGVFGMTCEPVRGFGRQMGQTENFSGSNYALNLVPKTRVEVVTLDDQLEAALDAIISAAQTGEMGDGKIFITEIVDAVRIRTGERGERALQ
jgi:nitrogen regulatory protein P-II 1